ncbi:panB [Symbiodinium microadriaticum]|nr:panB [Symbiodinium microadriaticum]
MITAYDFPSAKHAEYADIDIVLVGDSVGMVVLGYDTTQPAGVDAVKLEGGAVRAPTVQKLVESGIAVMGHVGLTPQGVSVLGGFRAQGRTAIKAKKILDDAMALQRAGAFSVVIECVPEIVARAITGSLKASDFPGVEHSPYKMAAAEMDIFKDMLVGDEQERQRESADIDQKNRAQDEYEAVKLY